MYPVDISIHNDNFMLRLTEIREWFQQRRIVPSTVRYRMTADHVQLLIEFTKPQDAEVFKRAFAAELARTAQLDPRLDFQKPTRDL